MRSVKIFLSKRQIVIFRGFSISEEKDILLLKSNTAVTFRTSLNYHADQA